MTPPPRDRGPKVWNIVQPGAAPQTAPQTAQRDAAAVLKEHGVQVPADCPPHIIAEVARMVSYLWLNGQIVAREAFYIDPADQGLLFGRGLWECTRTFGGVPWLWPLHLERLVQTAALLEIDVDPQRLPDSAAVTAFVRALTRMDVVVRLNATAGPPGKPGTMWMTAVLPPAPTPSIRLQSCRGPVLAGQPYLAWKTFQYGSRLRASQQARQAGFDNALLLDPDGNILEAANANLFVRLPDGWATPPAAGETLLPGTVRRFLLEESPLPMRGQVIPYARLADVREAFVTNSNVGLVPVAQIDEQTFPIGRETRELLRWLVPA
jgi:branched-subunit amino acid aminotransferase/4-amino-4-deoxychorismate lyase